MVTNFHTLFNALVMHCRLLIRSLDYAASLSTWPPMCKATLSTYVNILATVAYHHPVALVGRL